MVQREPLPIIAVVGVYRTIGIGGAGPTGAYRTMGGPDATQGWDNPGLYDSTPLAYIGIVAIMICEGGIAMPMVHGTQCWMTTWRWCTQNESDAVDHCPRGSSRCATPTPIGRGGIKCRNHCPT